MDESLKDAILGTCMVLMSIVTVIGNILVILIILNNKKLRTKENAFILSLAVSDLLVGIFVMPMATVKDLMTWRLGETLCHFWQVVDLTCTTSSIFSICAVSVVRYLRIKKPYRYSKIMTRKVVVLSLAFIWVVPTIATLFRYFFMFCKKKSEYYDRRNMCVIVESHSSSTVSSLVNYFLPCLVMVCIYGHLYSCSRRHLRHISEYNPYQRARNNYKTAVTIGVIMGAFLLCWIPFNVALLVHNAYKYSVSDGLFTIFMWFGYSNSMLDPIVYSLMNKEFRKPFKVSFHRFFQRQSYNI